MSTPLGLDQLHLPEDLGLIVAWKQGDGYDGGEVRITPNVAEHLRQACHRTLDAIREREERPYTPDMHLEAGDETLVVEDPQLIGDSQVAAIVLPTQPLQVLNASSLPRRPLQLYAALARTPDGDVAFIRKTNPHKAARPGKLYTMLGQSLARIGGPIFALDDHFDLVVTEQGVVSLEQSYFELLFREVPALQERIPEWVEAIEVHLPIAHDGASRLAARAETDGRLRRRLRSIAERGHLENVSVDRIRKHIQEAGLSERDFLEGDQLRFDEANPFALVYLLNEDFFQGGLTDVPFRSDRKSPR
jgi:hypothetical protein